MNSLKIKGIFRYSQSFSRDDLIFVFVIIVYFLILRRTCPFTIFKSVGKFLQIWFICPSICRPCYNQHNYSPIFNKFICIIGVNYSMFDVENGVCNFYTISLGNLHRIRIHLQSSGKNRLMRILTILNYFKVIEIDMYHWSLL